MYYMILSTRQVNDNKVEIVMCDWHLMCAVKSFLIKLAILILELSLFFSIQTSESHLYVCFFILDLGQC